MNSRNGAIAPTVAKVVKSYGFRSSKEASEYLETTTETLRNWHANYPMRFEAAMIGASIVRNRKFIEAAK